MSIRKLDELAMAESLRCFIEEDIPDAGMVNDTGIPNPDIFIIIAGKGNDLTFTSSSNSYKKTLDTLKRAVALHTAPVDDDNE